MSGIKNSFGLKSWKTLIYVICWGGALQFIILTIIAMLFVPGGYDFLKYPFSYLSLTTINGIPNTIARPLSVIAGLGAAIALVPFWIIMITLFTKPIIAKILSLVGSRFQRMVKNHPQTEVQLKIISLHLC